MKTEKKAAHTPGPWTIGRHPMLEVAAIPANGDVASRKIICGVSLEEDARLIAAAPEYHAWAEKMLSKCGIEAGDFEELEKIHAKVEGK